MRDLELFVWPILIFGSLLTFAILAYLKTRRDEKEEKEKTFWNSAAGPAGLIVFPVLCVVADYLVKNKYATLFQVGTGLFILLGVFIIIWYKN